MTVVRSLSLKYGLLRLILLFAFTSWMSACSLETEIEDLVKAESKPTITVSDLTLIENGGPDDLVVSINKVWSDDVVIPFSTVAGSATSAVDYSNLSGQVTIVAGSTTATITLTPVNDSLYESTEAFKLQFTSPANANMSAASAGLLEKTVAITDDETQPNVQFAVATDSVSEDVLGGSHTVTVSLSGAAQAAVTVNYSVTNTAASGAAVGASAMAAGIDYTLTGGTSGGTLTFPSGSTTATFVVTLNDDTISELSEPAELTLASPTVVTMGTNSVETLSIVDDDGTPTLEYSAATSSTAENVSGGTQTFTVLLSNPSSQAVTVAYAVTGGTATGSGTDYTLAGGTLTFAAGQTVRTFTAAVVNDLISEATETIDLNLSAPSNASLGSQSTHVVSITDNDGTPVVTFSAASQNINENAGTANLVAVLTNPSAQQITVDYSVTAGTATGSGTDYTLASGTLTFAAGSTTQTVAMSVVSDSIDESDETVVVSLANPTNATLGTPIVHTATIVDDDSAPVITFAAATQNSNENAGTTNVVVNLSNASATAVTVDYGVTGGTATGSGTDYTLASGTLTFAAGVTTQNVALAIIDDSISELTETVQISLSNQTGSTIGVPGIHTHSIIDNELLPTVQFATATDSTGEATASKNIVVVLNYASSQSVSVDYAVTSGTATGSGTDYTLTAGTLTFAAGVTTQNVALAVVNDALAEGNETIVVTLSNPNVYATIGTTGVHTHTIVDDESAPTIYFAAATSSSAENVGSHTIVVNKSGADVSSVTVNFAVTNTVPGAGIANGGGTDYTLANGTLTFAAGETTKNIVMPVVDDSLGEPNEVIAIALSSVSGGLATLGAQSTHDYTINANDTPTIQYAVVTASVAENVSGGTHSVVVTLSHAASADVTADFAVTGGSATGSGTDYSILTSSPLTITAGSTTATLAWTITNDGTYEGNETVALNLTNSSSGASLGSQVTHTTTITDDDTVPTVQFAAATSNAGEATTPHTIAVTLSGPLSVASTVDYSVTGGTASGGGTDYTLANGTLTFAAGVTTLNISPVIVNDNIYEGAETITLAIANPSAVTLGTLTTHTHTINDNETAPTIQFASSTLSIYEDGSSFPSYDITLSGPSSTAVLVDVGIANGTASSSDYSEANRTVTIAAGSTIASYFPNAVDDLIAEGSETYTATLSSPTGATVGSPSVLTVTILDDESTPEVQFAAATSNAGEATTPHTIVVLLTGSSSIQSTVAYAVTSGTATGSGTDYTLASGTLTFAAGVTTQTISTAIVNDSIFEGNETLVVTLSSPTTVTLGSQSTHTHTITDDETAPTVQYAAATSNAGEATTPHQIVVTLSSAAQAQSTINYSVTGGTAAGSGTDFTLSAGTLTFASLATTATISIAVVNDAIYEGSETIELDISGPTVVTLGSQTTHTHTINDDETAPTVQFASATSTVGEATTPHTIAVTLSGASSAAATVSYSITGGTATSGGTDFTLANGTLTFAAGVTTQNISVAIVNDLVDETNETFVVTLGSPSGASLGTTTAHTATITDDDSAPVITFASSTASSNENVGSATIVANLSNPSASQVTVDYSVTGGSATGSGTDFTLAAGTLTFAAGVTTQNLVVAIVDDTISELTEDIQITLATPANATIGVPGVHTHSIIDNESLPTLNFASATDSTGEATASKTIPVTLSGASSQSVTVNYSVTGGTATGSGTDFTLASGTLTFAAGVTSQNITLSVVNDVLAEGNETVQITIATPNAYATIGSTNAHTHTINDNDAAPTIYFAAATSSAAENVGSHTIVVSMSGGDAAQVTVNYSVTNTVPAAGVATGGGTDYTLANGTLTFAAGVTTQNLVIPVVDDTLGEPNELVALQLSGVAGGLTTLGAQSTHNFTINANDTPTIQYAAATANVAENVGGGSYSVFVTLSGAASADATVDFAVTGGTAVGTGTD